MLDCCYVPSGSKDGRCCVFCGPNAGLWETHALSMQVKFHTTVHGREATVFAYENGHYYMQYRNNVKIVLLG